MSKLIDTQLDAAGDLVLVRNDVEIGRVDAAGNVTTKGSVNGGSLPAITSSITRDSYGRVSAFVNSAGSYTVTYDSSSRVLTVSNGTTTRTISRDSSGRVTGVA